MSASNAVRARLSRLLLEAVEEIGALERISAELSEFHPALGIDPPGRPVLALVAVDLHDYYTAAETLFERIARAVDGSVPSGSESHLELVNQMAAELPPIRPAVLDSDTRRWLHDLRRFRDFFRHAYAVPLDAEHLRAHVDQLIRRDRDFRASLDTFLTFVRASRDALNGA